MAQQVERVKLGVLDGKEYHLNVKEASIDWRIPDIREMVRAEAGYKILCCDYSQIEVKLMAYLSGDPWLISAINSGKDIHCYMATEVFGQSMGFDYDVIKKAIKDEDHPRYDELKKLRSDIKTVTFGVPYGAGPPRVAAMTGKTVEEAQELIALYFEKAVVLKQWLEVQGRQAIINGYTTSPRGRKRFYLMPANDDPEKDQILGQIRRWAGNHPIQAGNVDMLKPSMKRIYDALGDRGMTWEEARILFVVHDEIIMTAKDELTSTVRTIMWESMKAAYDVIIPNILSGFEDTTDKNGEFKPGIEAVLVDDIWVKD
jgi:DNA polymerase-1